MLHHFRLLPVTIAASFFMIACSSDTNENSSGETLSTDSVETVLLEEVENPESALPMETTSAEDTAAVEDVAEVEEPSEEVVETEEADQAESAESELTALDPLTQLAIEEITEAMGFDKESHTFLFSQEEDYIEIEVREKKEDGAAPLVGRYRYILEKDKILTMDYLTGEFMPAEESEE